MATPTAAQIQERIDAHNAYVAEHGAYQVTAPSAVKVRGPRPARGKEPTLAQAIAAGTQVTLVPSFVADMVAILVTEDAEAWARASLLREKAARRFNFRDPRHPETGGYMSDGAWLKAKAIVGRKLLRLVQGMTPDALVNLTDDPQDTWRMSMDMVASVRRCQPEAA